jgi:hypothetical protein
MEIRKNRKVSNFKQGSEVLSFRVSTEQKKTIVAFCQKHQISYSEFLAALCELFFYTQKMFKKK